jgi:hypothetical protein
MTRIDSRIWWGVLLIVGGVLFLLQNVGVIFLGNLVWAILLGAAGIAFLTVVIRNHQNWWAVIPGLILTYLAILMLLDLIFPAFSNNFGGPLFLGIIGAAFIIVYLINRSHWWAVIPGGVMLSLAVVATSDRFLPGLQSGGLFFIGLGITFLVLSLLPSPMGRMRWSVIPGGVLFLMGVLLTLSETGLLNVLWPVALILAGIYLFFARAPIRRA